jgi:hypothetical protein
VAIMEKIDDYLKQIRVEVSEYIIEEHLQLGLPVEYLVKECRNSKKLISASIIIYNLMRRLGRNELEKQFGPMSEYQNDSCGFKRIINSLMDSVE